MTKQSAMQTKPCPLCGPIDSRRTAAAPAQPTSQPASIGDDAEFRKLANSWAGAVQGCDHRTRTVVAPQAWAKLVAYVDARAARDKEK